LFRVPEHLHIEFEKHRTAYRPGDEIRGTARWELSAVPTKVAVHLCWFTQGKGSEDSEVVAEQNLAAGTARGESAFSFRAPEQPYSFSGILISIIWAVELVTDPGDACERVEIVIGPEAEEIDLIPKATVESGAGLPASKVL
jgi:hypothetical protein